MKLKKVLTGSALSLALLVSAAPAFASSPGHTNIDSTANKNFDTSDQRFFYNGLPS